MANAFFRTNNISRIESNKLQKFDMRRIGWKIPTAAANLLSLPYSIQANCEERPRSAAESKQYQYIIVGLGIAGASAAREIIRKSCNNERLLIVDRQLHAKLKYTNLIKDDRVALLESTVRNIDAENKILLLTDGRRISFDKCLIAVGSAPPELDEIHIDYECNLKDTVVDLSQFGAATQLFTTVMNSKSSKPRHVALVGANCWETVDLAAKLAVGSAVIGQYRGK